MGEYHYTVSPDRLAVHTLLCDIEKICHQEQAQAHLSKRTIFFVCLIIDELLTNIISYGMAHQPSPSIKMYVKITFKKIFVHLKDNGIAFNPLLFILSENKKNLENRPIGNVGIQFVKTFSRNIVYHHTDGFNCLQFECHEESDATRGH